MAVSLITTIHVFQGESADPKPRTGIHSGSVLHETDTGRTFKFKDGDWHEDKSSSLSVGEYQQGNADLRRLMEQTLLEVQATNLNNGIEVR